MVVGAEGWVSACPLERVESDAVAELCNSNNGGIIFVDEFPKTYETE
jgi:hypothetical protein